MRNATSQEIRETDGKARENVRMRGNAAEHGDSTSCDVKIVYR